MSFKKMFGLDDTPLSDEEIAARIKDAITKNLTELEFARKDGTAIVIKLSQGDFGKYLDPWDGKQGKGNYPHQ